MHVFGLTVPNASKVKVQWTYPYKNSSISSATSNDVAEGLGCSSNGDITVCALPGAGVVGLGSDGTAIYHIPASVIDTASNVKSVPVVSGERIASH